MLPVTEGDKAFFEYMKRHHSGREKAIISKEIFGWGTKRELRLTTHRLRVACYPLCFSNKGLFVAATINEVRSTYRRVDSYIKSLTEVKEGLHVAYLEF